MNSILMTLFPRLRFSWIICLAWVASADQATVALAIEARVSRLVYTPPANWERLVDAENGSVSLKAPGGDASVTWVKSTAFAGTAEQWQDTLWAGFSEEMTPTGAPVPGVQGRFLSRLGGFVRADGIRPWVNLYSLVDDGRGEGLIYFARDRASYLANLKAVTALVIGLKVAPVANDSAITAPTDSLATPPLGSASRPIVDSMKKTGFIPRLTYQAPTAFYQGAGTSPVEFSSQEVNCSVQVYPFQPLNGDPRSHFYQSLLRDRIDPRFQETTLVGSPEIQEVKISGATTAWSARFHEAIAGTPNERYRLAIVAGNQVAIVDAVANSAYSWDKAGPGLRKLLDSLRVENSSAPVVAIGSTSPANTAIAGLYRGNKTNYIPNMNRMVGSGDQLLAPHYYLFTADGRFHRCYNLPPGKNPEHPGPFDLNATARNDPGNTGHYVVRDREIHLQLADGNTSHGTIIDQGRIEIDTIKYAREP